MKKKINFKQPKYIIPLIILPFLLFIGYQVISVMEKEEEKPVQKEIATSLGKVDTSIMSKNEAYDKLFEDTRDNRSMIGEIESEKDSLFNYTDNLNENQKRYLDSLAYERKKASDNQKSVNSNKSYYSADDAKKSKEPEKDADFERSKEIIKMLNDAQQSQNVSQGEETQEYDPVRALREQMLFLDSLEKSKDPEFQRKMNAQNKLKENKEKMEAFLNKTLKVSKQNRLGGFNHISKETDNNTIKAVIDENIKGYLGSRIRIRLLEDIYIGKKKRHIKKGSFLFAEISGFTMQRVNLSIISVMANNEIFPINLSIYDMDGHKGLYVPASAFREMVRELGTNSVQGMNMENGQGFFSSLASNLFRSASETVVAIIRKNKVTLKYNTYIYLIDEQDLKNE